MFAESKSENLDSLNNVRCESSKTFRNKRTVEISERTKIYELETKSKNIYRKLR
jgi:hypothetical protein